MEGQYRTSNKLNINVLFYFCPVVSTTGTHDHRAIRMCISSKHVAINDTALKVTIDKEEIDGNIMWMFTSDGKIAGRV